MSNHRHVPVDFDRLRIDKLRNGFYLNQQVGTGEGDGKALDVVGEVLALDEDDLISRVRAWVRGEEL